MTTAMNIADRHSKAVAGLGDHGGPGLRVRLLAGSLASNADQHLVMCMVNLLCRMAGTVSVVELELPATALAVAAPHRPAGGDAFETLETLADWATGGAVPVVRAGLSDDVFRIAIGARPAVDRADLFAHGRGWRARVGTAPPRAAGNDEAGASNPMGPYLAAAVAAGEVFKHARGLVRGRFAEDWAYSLWDGKLGDFDDLEDGPDLAGAVLPPFHLVGAGGVGQGLLCLLGAAGLSSAAHATVDDDRHDGTNLNRCFLAGVDDVDRPKVEAVGRHRKMHRLAGSEFDGTLNELVMRGPPADLPAALTAAQLADDYQLVVSAVDRNTSRWDIQGLRPGLVVGGSTDGLTAKAISYSMRPGQACLACHNPREDDGARLREIERAVRGMDESGVRAHLAGRLDGEQIEAVLAYLRSAPGCGSAGERALGQLAAASPGEFSASFVSMAAATLLLARLLTTIAFAPVAPDRAQMTTLSLRNLDAGDDTLALDRSCPFH